MKQHLYVQWQGVKKDLWRTLKRPTRNDIPLEVLVREEMCPPMCAICAWKKDHPFHH